MTHCEWSGEDDTVYLGVYTSLGCLDRQRERRGAPQTPPGPGRVGSMPPSLWGQVRLDMVLALAHILQTVRTECVWACMVNDMASTTDALATILLLSILVSCVGEGRASGDTIESQACRAGETGPGCSKASLECEEVLINELRLSFTKV